MFELWIAMAAEGVFHSVLGPRPFRREQQVVDGIPEVMNTEGLTGLVQGKGEEAAAGAVSRSWTKAGV